MQAASVFGSLLELYLDASLVCYGCSSGDLPRARKSRYRLNFPMNSPFFERATSLSTSRLLVSFAGCSTLPSYNRLTLQFWHRPVLIEYDSST